MGITEIVEDMEAIAAVEILQEYCHSHKCRVCIFSKDGKCPFREKKNAPAFWNISPKGKFHIKK